MSALVAHGDPAAPAILEADSGRETRYGELRERVSQLADVLRRELEGGLVFLIAGETRDPILVYLACLEAGCPVVLLEPGLLSRLGPLLDAYRPEAIFAPKQAASQVELGKPLLEVGDGALHIFPTRAREERVHPELAVLLTTSGSTGSPKVVRLTEANLLANARSIASYLELAPGERSIQGLPIQYSYGLSLVNSHLIAGATIVLTQHSFMRPEFWQAFDQSHCTSFAGVPYVYETLHRLRFDPAQHPTLRTLTQAGGGLRKDLIESFHQRSQAAGCRFFVMYGQTEATARISYVPWDRLGDKIGSIGIAIPGGHLSLEGLDDSDEQELVYAGPNVMMGYAESRSGLAAGDELAGRLRTGDLARADEDGFFHLTGRLTRFAKLFGRRVSLEDVEREFEARHGADVAVVEREGGLRVFVAAPGGVDAREAAREIGQDLGVTPRAITVEAVSEIPRTASGKKDYKALT